MVEAVAILLAFLAWAMLVGWVLVTLLQIRREAEEIKVELAGMVDRVEAIRGEAESLRVLVAAIQATVTGAVMGLDPDQIRALGPVHRLLGTAADDPGTDTEIRTTTTADRPGRIVAIMDEEDDRDDT